MLDRFSSSPNNRRTHRVHFFFFLSFFFVSYNISYDSGVLIIVIIQFSLVFLGSVQVLDMIRDQM